MGFEGLEGIGQIALTVDDVERATGFYRDALGLPFLFAAPPQLAFFDCGGVRLMITAPEGGTAPGAGSVVYFKVADIDAAFRTLRSRGVAFADEPHLIAKLAAGELWMTFFRDPAGNPLALMSERA
ncbi:MAG: VOC family protein [Thermoanaerobaculia bacterium]